MSCKKVQEISAGDQIIFIGEVISSEKGESKRIQVVDNRVYFG